MKKILGILLLLVVFAVALPFVGNKSVKVDHPHHLDADGNFILHEWVEPHTGGGPDWDYNLHPVQVSERVWCFFGAMEMPTKDNAGDMSNSCYIKGNDSWIAWDSGPSAIFAKQAYAAMKKIADLPVKTVVISHEHDDHWLGNSFYKKEFNATIIGPTTITENYYGPRHIDGKDYPGMQTRMIKALYQNAIRGTVLAMPDKTFEDTAKLDISGVKMEYVKVGYAHSEEDWFLYLPDDKVALVADVVMNGRVTSNRDGVVVGQINALNKIKSKDWEHLVPGHGFITDKTAADEAVLYFKLIKDRVLEKMDEGVTADYITKEVTLDEFRDKDLYYVLSAGNVFRSYEELEMFDEDSIIDYSKEGGDDSAAEESEDEESDTATSNSEEAKPDAATESTGDEQSNTEAKEAA